MGKTCLQELLEYLLYIFRNGEWDEKMIDRVTKIADVYGFTISEDGFLE